MNRNDKLGAFLMGINIVCGNDRILDNKWEYYNTIIAAKDDVFIDFDIGPGSKTNITRINLILKHYGMLIKQRDMQLIFVNVNRREQYYISGQFTINTETLRLTHGALGIATGPLLRGVHKK